MLQKATLTFIKNLQKNNVKEWFDANRPAYEAARADLAALVTDILKHHSKRDEDLAPLVAKDCMFRINRDIRFSKDKTPYKSHLAAEFSRGGKKGPFAGYYLHIEPGNKSMIGGGLWAPETDNLKKVRQEIDYSFDEFSGIIQDKNFKKVFGDLYTDDEVLLSRPPKGYTDDNPAIKYLKLKSFIAMRDLKDEELTSDKLLPIILSSMETLQPLLQFINRAIEG